MSNRRVVVTGTSLVTSLGCDVSDVWTRICNGDSGISPIERFDCSEVRVRFGGEIKDFDPQSLMDIDGKTLRRIVRFSQFALVASDQAVRQAGLQFENMDVTRCGVVIGSGIGGLEEIEDQHSRLFDQGPERVSAFMIPKLIVNAASGNVSVHYGLQGPSLAISTACASAAQSIGSCYRMIQYGTADVMLAGGSEAPLTPMGLSGFARMRALSTHNDSPTTASRPFDADRDGFVMSEGAGVLVLEELEFAKARGANILAEVVGYGTASDATHIAAPDEHGAGAARSMTAALKDARMAPSEVDYINAHGTSTPLGDKAETCAVRTVFGSDADSLAVSSTKGQTGHSLGASGGVESVFCIKAIETQTAPPTINLDNPGEGCDLDYVANTARDMKIKVTMKNNFGFGGHNATLIFAAMK
jgi:3-oxoacyl-[acyl-carrier-protein] synthase II